MLTSRQELADYALRQLGGGVINIELSDDQISDAVEDAISFYQENHFDGIERDYLATVINGTYFTCADVTNIAVDDYVTVEAKNLTAKVIAVDTGTKKIRVARGQNAASGVFFATGDTIVNDKATATTTISAVRVGELDLGYITIPEDVMGIINVTNPPFLSSAYQGSDILFSANYQLMAGEIQHLLSGGGNLQGYFGTMNYLSEMEFVLRRQKSFRYNRRMNKLFLDINWDQDVSNGSYIVAEVYRAVSDETYPNVYNDIWLKRYTTALMKKIWGNNTKKYGGMKLPGGLTYNGQQVYDEAVNEIKELEQEAIEKSAPLGFMVG